jgi:hypothetical protein
MNSESRFLTTEPALARGDRFIQGRRRVFARLAVLTCAAGLVVAGCADFSRGTEAVALDAGDDLTLDVGADGDPGDATLTSFATTVHPLLLAKCQRCHATGAQAGDTQLLFTGAAAADDVTVSRFVDTSAPAGSRLLSKASGNGHGGGTVLPVGSPDYQTVLLWIQQGARP